MKLSLYRRNPYQNTRNPEGDKGGNAGPFSDGVRENSLHITSNARYPINYLRNGICYFRGKVRTILTVVELGATRSQSSSAGIGCRATVVPGGDAVNLVRLDGIKPHSRNEYLRSRSDLSNIWFVSGTH